MKKESYRIQDVWVPLRVIRSGNGFKTSLYYRNRRAIAGLRARIPDSTGMDCATLLDSSGFRIRAPGDSGIQ